ncbi:hypothetical protein L9F63_014120, partial [Diploptera punctata]
TENYCSTSIETVDSNSTPEKQSNMKHSSKTNVINEFLSNKKTGAEKLNVSVILAKNSKEDLIRKSEYASLQSKGPRSIYCIARWCGRSTKEPGISLFRLPKDKERAHLWLTNAEREDLKNLSSQILHTKYLCMDHFTDDMFMNSCKKKLIWNAIPTHFPKPKYAFKKQPQTNSHQNNVGSLFPARLVFISESHSSNKLRPIKPKPQDMDEKNTAELNSNESKIPNNSGDLDISARIMKTPTSIVSETKNVETIVEDTVKATLKSSTSVNDINLKQDKIEIVRQNSELPCVSNVDVAKKEDSNSTSLCDKKATSENYNIMNDESYLNCDAESICLEHAYRETNERIYSCRYCGEMFLVKSHLILHQTTYHSDRPVGCDSCGRVLYKSRSEFMEHVCDHHTDGTQTAHH